MSYQRLAHCLLSGKPYFGSALFARQGFIERHRYFLPMLRACNVTDRPLRVLEVGSWAGASAISWALGLRAAGLEGHVLCVDAWKPYFDLELNKEEVYSGMHEAASSGDILKLFEHNLTTCGVRSQVSYQRGESTDILPSLSDASFDLVYVDGAHDFEHARFDLQQSKRLGIEGGIVCGDDRELEKGRIPAKVHAKALASGQDFVFVPSLKKSYHPGVTGAVADCFRTVSVWNGFWGVRKGKQSWAKIDCDVSGSPIPPHLAADLEQEDDAVSQGEMQVQFVLETPQYSIVRARKKFIAVAKQLGPTDLFHERLGERDLGDLVITGASLKDVKARAAANENAPLATGAKRIGETEKYNLVESMGRFVAIAKSLGPTDLFGERVGDRNLSDLVLTGINFEDLKARALESEKAARITPLQQAGETDAYSLVEYDEGFLAVAKSLGP